MKRRFLLTGVFLISGLCTVKAQADSLKDIFTLGYGFRFGEERIGMQLSLEYGLHYPMGQSGFMSRLTARAGYSNLPYRKVFTGETESGADYYARQEGQFYIVSLGAKKSFGYQYHFIDLGLEAQLWQFKGFFVEEYENQRYRYDRLQADRYAAAILGYSYKRSKSLGFSVFWNPQIRHLDEARRELRRKNFVVEVVYSF